MDFNWPLDKVWEGYLNPYYGKECPACKGYGHNGLYGLCPTCEGEGRLWDSPADKQKYEAWEPQEPPVGLGFQLWETTTEGSPQSPVFATLEELAAWCEENATVFAKEKASAEEWLKMLAEDKVYFREGNHVFI
jgi:hypothetical protein